MERTNVHTNGNQMKGKDIKRKNRTTTTIEQNESGKQKRKWKTKTKMIAMHIKVRKETTKPCT